MGVHCMPAQPTKDTPQPHKRVGRVENVKADEMCGDIHRDAKQINNTKNKLVHELHAAGICRKIFDYTQ